MGSLSDGALRSPNDLSLKKVVKVGDNKTKVKPVTGTQLDYRTRVAFHLIALVTATNLESNELPGYD